jgi:monoamine oxidase
MARSLFARLADRYEPRGPRLRRREALKLMGLSAAGAMAGCVGLGKTGGRTGRAVVIGAGFAGLSAAERLRRGGWEVTVLEARGRVGGRVVRIDSIGGGDAYAEGGGEWIGLNHPRWLAHAKRLGLRLIEATEEDGEAPIVLGGRRLGPDEAEALYEEMELHLAALTEASASVRADAPWESPGAAELDAESVAYWLAGRGMSESCLAASRAMLEHDNAAAAERMSLLGLLAMVAGGGGESFWTDSEVYRCAGGNARLAQGLAEDLGWSRIRLREPAAGVAIGINGCTVMTERGSYNADSVVIAVPPSVWDTLKITGPDGETMAPAAPSMGPAAKLLVRAERAWWREGGLSPDALSDGAAGYTWNATDGQATPRPIVCGFGAGPAIAGMTQGDPRPMRDGIEKLLPGLAAARAQGPESERFMHWPSDPWARAGYSFPAPGEVTGAVRALHAGVTAGGRVRLAFAGEHTAMAFTGYMEGALASGHAAAMRLMA